MMGREYPEKDEVKILTSGLAEEKVMNAATRNEKKRNLFMVEGCGEDRR